VSSEFGRWQEIIDRFWKEAKLGGTFRTETGSVPAGLIAEGMQQEKDFMRDFSAVLEEDGTTEAAARLCALRWEAFVLAPDPFVAMVKEHILTVASAGRTFWQHIPLEATRCVLDRLSQVETSDHLNEDGTAKLDDLGPMTELATVTIMGRQHYRLRPPPPGAAPVS